MKKHLFIVLTIFYPLFAFSQAVEVEGQLKVTDMDIYRHTMKMIQ